MHNALAQSSEKYGLEVMTRMIRQDDGFVDSTSAMKMTLITASGKKSVRHIRNRVKEVPGDGDKSIAIFDKPTDVKGATSLTYSHMLSPDEQWLYLPSLKRVKRVSSKNKTGAFMGSEFAFEDLGSQEIEKYTYKYISEDILNGVEVHKIEMYPAYRYSGYSKLINYIDKDNNISLKVEYYDRKNSLLKTLKLSDYHLYENKYWRSHRQEMANIQTNKSTVLEFSEYAFKSGLRDKEFRYNHLKNIR